jgi:hypothetical protein
MSDFDIRISNINKKFDFKTSRAQGTLDWDHHVNHEQLVLGFNRFINHTLTPGMTISVLKVNEGKRSNACTTAYIRLNETDRQHELIQLLNQATFRDRFLKEAFSQTPSKQVKEKIEAWGTATWATNTNRQIRAEDPTQEAVTELSNIINTLNEGKWAPDSNLAGVDLHDLNTGDEFDRIINTATQESERTANQVRRRHPNAAPLKSPSRHLVVNNHENAPPPKCKADYEIFSARDSKRHAPQPPSVASPVTKKARASSPHLSPVSSSSESSADEEDNIDLLELYETEHAKLMARSDAREAERQREAEALLPPDYKTRGNPFKRGMGSRPIPPRPTVASQVCKARIDQLFEHFKGPVEYIRNVQAAAEKEYHRRSPRSVVEISTRIAAAPTIIVVSLLEGRYVACGQACSKSASLTL